MGENLELEKTLWATADKLRNNMDAVEYKHVVLGLISLKYISDAFDELYTKLNAEKDKTGADPEDRDEYTAERVFYVPPQARWKWLQGRAKLPTIGKNNYILTPGRYIDFKEAEEDEQAFDEKMKHLTATLKKQMNKAKDLDETIKNNLSKIGYGF